MGASERRAPIFYLEKGHFCYHVFAIKQNVSVREIKHKVALLPTYALRHSEGGRFFFVWWSRRELNPRPQILHYQFYVCSLLIWF